MEVPQDFAFGGNLSDLLIIMREVISAGAGARSKMRITVGRTHLRRDRILVDDRDFLTCRKKASEIRLMTPLSIGSPTR